MSVVTILPVRLQASRREVTATRLVFFASGLAVASWAPLVPFVKAKLEIDNGSLGLLLLCVGVGSLIGMPIAGPLTAHLGCRRVIATASAVFTILVPVVTSLGSWPFVAIALCLFGAAGGVMEVAINVQSVFVERDSGKPMLSGFHALWSVGGIVGAASVSLLLAVGTGALVAAETMAVLGLAALVAAYSGLLPYGDQSEAKAPLFVRPRGDVLFIGALLFFAYLAEGSVLDWSAVFLRSMRNADPTTAGLGYAVFASAMTAGRFAGDRIRATFGEPRILLFGGLVACLGFLVVVLVPSAAAGLSGFFLIGVGGCNIVPVLFSITGGTQSMPQSLAIASVTTIGALGVLAGPASIGFVANLAGLPVALLVVAAAMLIIAGSSRVARPQRNAEAASSGPFVD